jgi:two-component system, OmpR family, phosphate regulon response regulator PhoB
MISCVAVVEDEPDILESLCLALRREGHEAVGFTDGSEALLGFRERVPDVVLLDWMLPGLSGMELCRILRGDRRFARTTICMLTARATETDIVSGLGAGADDYVTKPFSMREVMARVKTLLRRTCGADEAGALRRAGTLWLDPCTYRAGEGDRPFDLTPTEFKLLDLLLRHPSRVYSRGQIITTLWPDDRAVEDRVVDVHVARLREKMGRSGGRVETVRGVGYRLHAG